MIKKPKHIQALFLGNMDYFYAIKLQEKINLLVQSNELNEIILFLEHDNVLTYGSQEKITLSEINKLNADSSNILHVKSNRGGQITLHNPGQLICYPIINIKKYFNGILDYVRFLENVIINTLKSYGVYSNTVEKRRGIWVNGIQDEKYNELKNPTGEKIAALGLKVIRNISLHGFSLNVNNDLDLFNRFIPCGMPNLRVNSISNLIDKDIEIKGIAKNLSLNMSKLLEVPIEFITDNNKIGVKID